MHTYGYRMSSSGSKGKMSKGSSTGDHDKKIPFGFFLCFVYSLCEP